MNANNRKYLVCAPAAHYTKKALTSNCNNVLGLQILEHLFAVSFSFDFYLPLFSARQA